MITRSSSEEAGTQFFRVLMRCRIKKAVVGVTQLITALVSIYSSMTFLVDMYSFLDPPGRTVLLSVDDRSLFPVDCLIGLMRMVGECWLAIFRQTGCALKAVHIRKEGHRNVLRMMIPKYCLYEFHAFSRIYTQTQQLFVIYFMTYFYAPISTVQFFETWCISRYACALH